MGKTREVGEMSAYFVYMLRCSGDVYYTGLTTDIARRYRLHLSGKGAKFTRSHPPEAIAAAWHCGDKAAAAKVEYDGLSNSQPLRVDANNHTVTMLVQINGRFLTDDTRHGIVFKDGSNGHKSLFMAYATPKAFYEALKEAGGTPGENMTMDNKETTHVTGSKLDISVNWQGAAKAYSFDEVIVDSNGKKLDMRFGGNLTAAEEKKTGCLVCLDSCPVGIVSNATYTYGAVEKRGEVKFKGNASVLPADNTLATVTFKITE